MFTGLIEEIGRVLSISQAKYSIQISISASRVIKNAKIGDSIATNGVCLTVVDMGADYFVADCMHETIKRTNLAMLSVGEEVNLEKSVTLNSFLGGHIVLGDVDSCATIENIELDGISKIYSFKIPKQYLKYIVKKGRITIDGASLTVSEIKGEIVCVSLIPHSLENLTLGKKQVGDIVNIETDIFAKYTEKILLAQKNLNLDQDTESNEEITHEFLMSNGF